MVDDASIAGILSRDDDPRLAAQHLLDEALRRGGKDNVTIVVARYRVAGDSQPIVGPQDTEPEPTTDSFGEIPGAPEV